MLAPPVQRRALVRHAARRSETPVIRCALTHLGVRYVALAASGFAGTLLCSRASGPTSLPGGIPAHGNSPLRKFSRTLHHGLGCGDGRITAEIAARVPRGSALG